MSPRDDISHEGVAVGPDATGPDGPHEYEVIRAVLAGISTEFFVVLDVDATVRLVSAAAPSVLRYGLVTAGSLDIVALLHPDDLALGEEAWRQTTARPGDSVAVECRLRHEDGEWRWFRIEFHNFTNDPRIGAIACHVEDITQNHETETETELRNAERRLDALLENADGSAAVFDAAGEVKWFSINGGLPLGLTNQEFIEGVRRDLVHPEDLSKIQHEFVIVRVAKGDETGAVGLAQEVLAAFDMPFDLELGDSPSEVSEVYIDASIGVAPSNVHVSTPEDLIRSADAAMYKAKARGRGRWEIFDDALRARVVARHELQVGLRRAIDRQEFEVHYQPIVSTASMGADMVGAEALVRWRHPERDLLSPLEFIGEAEDTARSCTRRRDVPARTFARPVGGGRRRRGSRTETRQPS